MVDTKTVREALVEYFGGKFGGKAAWRQSIADRYPHDSRNYKSIKAIEEVVNYLAGLPDDDPILQRFTRMESPFREGVFTAPREDETESLCESRSDKEAGQCGFYSEETPSAFLESWAGTIESELAAAAEFEANARKDSVQRLRESKLEADAEDFAAGSEAGKDWAKNTATHRELKRLGAARDRLGDDWKSLFTDDDDHSGHTAAEKLAFEIIPKADHDSDGAKDFWACVIGEDTDGPEEPEWLRGFATAALKSWAEDKAKLNKPHPVA